jgi:MYXO-CTERM domain-containing protein
MISLRAALVSPTFALLSALATSAQAQQTNFSVDVAASIDRGLAWLTGQNAWNGGAGDASGLVALTLLEKRVSADQRAEPTGYRNATPGDQQRIESIISYIINNHVNQSFYAYRDGANLMALSVYLRTGGPNQAGAANGVAVLFDRISANQNGDGYWCYSNGGCNDSSTTQFAVAGLAAARGVFSDPAYADPNRLARLNQMAATSAAGYRNGANQDGFTAGERGHGYNRGNASSYQQTASGLWAQVIGGADLNDGSVQGYLLWLRNHYKFTTTVPYYNSWQESYFYYLWSSSKAYTFLEDSGVQAAPGNVAPEDVGLLLPGDAPAWGERQVRLDPAAVRRAPQFGGEGPGYYVSPFEPARWYFDYAYYLISNQDAGGRYVRPEGIGSWTNYDGQAYALLVLERSVGGGCVDTDQDQICDFEDNCPGRNDPNQADSDGDGIGDVCDNCVDVANGDQADPDGDAFGSACDNCDLLPNPDQRDIDRDDIGDACDPVICIPSGPEVCDGVDNDCNGAVDESGLGEDQACDTGLIGQCGVGLTDCRGGALVCVQQFFPSDEVCDGLDNDCDDASDEGDPGGGVQCDTGVPGECAGGLTVCLEGRVQCIGDQQARPEICNGRDDDCDGESDEDNPEAGQNCDTGEPGACSAGLTDCRAGRLLCVQVGMPDAEVCDAIDNDCDGEVDEGDPQGGVVCATGLGGTCAAGLTHCVDGNVACVPDQLPTPELCNGLDDDCDDQIDQGNPEGDQRCDTGRRGVCADGRTMCRNGAVQCDPIGMPTDEVCDGLDNDCDGTADEGLGIGEPCQTDLPGVCGPGQRACEGGAVICAPLTPASPEVCDGLDNDCNALVDDGVVGIGEVCGTGRVGDCARGITACEGGVQICAPDDQPADELCNLRDDDCDGVIDDELRNACGTCGDLPFETCNGEDDDCDGVVDDSAPCPEGQGCAHGRCVDRCANNECADTLRCVDGLCVSACDLLTCDVGQVCEGGLCVDPCAGVQCAADQVCSGGACVAADCYSAGCAEGERCVDFICEADPCAELFCNEGEFCRDGACVPSCATVSCAFQQSCVDGACIDDPCAGITCPDGQACAAGACGGDPCAGITCGAGQRCEEGICSHDACFGILCPPAERCEVVEGTAQCVGAWAPIDDPSYEADAGVAEPDFGRPVDPSAGDFGTVETGDATLPSTNPDASRNIKQEADPVAGCACRTPGSGASSAFWALLPLGLAPLVRRRRRR